MDSRLGLVLVCGLIFTLSLGQADSDGDFISKNMKEDMKRLRAHFKPGGTPTIGRLLAEQESKKTSEQKLLLGEMLDVYLNIFSGLLNKTEDLNVRDSLANLSTKVRKLNEKYIQGKERDVRKQLHKLEALKTNERALINALDTFEMVYQRASQLEPTS